MKKLLLLALTVVCASCGWQLRGVAPGENILGEIKPEQLRLVLMDRKSQMSQPLKRQMHRLKIDLSAEAPTILVIEKEQLDKRPLAVTDTGVTAQYQLMYRVHYRYEDAQGESAKGSQKVVSWRSYDFDAKLILAKAQEEQALLNEMRDELAQRILGASR